MLRESWISERTTHRATALRLPSVVIWFPTRTRILTTSMSSVSKISLAGSKAYKSGSYVQFCEKLSLLILTDLSGQYSPTQLVRDSSSNRKTFGPPVLFPDHQPNVLRATPVVAAVKSWGPSSSATDSTALPTRACKLSSQFYNRRLWRLSLELKIFWFNTYYSTRFQYKNLHYSVGEKSILWSKMENMIFSREIQIEATMKMV